MEYKVKVPVCGGIILNQDLTKVLLVRGWKASAGWGFPKGKINKDEDEPSCAIRERSRIYIIAGISESYQFITQTRKEIGDIQWHPISQIPSNKKQDSDSNRNSLGVKKKYYMVSPFIGALKRWIRNFKRARQQGKDRKKANLKVVVDEDVSESDAITSDTMGGNWRQNTNAAEYEISQTDIINMTCTIKTMLGVKNVESALVSPNAPSLPIPNFQDVIVNQALQEHHPRRVSRPVVKGIISKSKVEAMSPEMQNAVLTQFCSEDGKSKTLLDMLTGSKAQEDKKQSNNKELLELLIKGKPSSDSATNTDSIVSTPKENASAELLDLLIKKEQKPNPSNQLLDLLIKGPSKSSPSEVDIPRETNTFNTANSIENQKSFLSNILLDRKTSQSQKSNKKEENTESRKKNDIFEMKDASNALLEVLLGSKDTTTSPTPSPIIQEPVKKPSDENGENDSRKAELLRFLLHGK